MTANASILDLKPINRLNAPTIRWRCSWHGSVVHRIAAIVYAKDREEAARVFANKYRSGFDVAQVIVTYDATIHSLGETPYGGIR